MIGSEFQKRVYRFVQKLPEGRVATYGYVARGIDCKSAQAVGQALSRNCNSDIPCHRVIAQNYYIGGYFGSADWQKKREILRREGVDFDDDGFLADRELLLQ